jgi:hypothetical protein
VGPDFDTSEQLNREMIATQLDYGGGGMPSFRGRVSGQRRDAVIEFVFKTLHQRR